MSSDRFELLGLDPATATDADVRRAYAERLKATRPEDDREGFMALRKAFEQARQSVRWRRNYEPPEQDHSPPDEYGQSSAEQGAALAETEPGTAAAVEDARRGDDPDPDEDDDGEVYDDYGPSPEELAAWRPIEAVMNRLTDVLTSTGRPPAVKDVLEVLEHEDVSGIDQYQTMQREVRQFICQRTGCFEEPPKTLRVPDWLSLEIFDALEGYYGWSRQASTSPYIRGLNDWMDKVRRAIVLEASTEPERKQAAFEEVRADLFGGREQTQTSNAGTGKSGGAIWLWIGAAILLSQVARFLGSLNGG